MRSLLFTAASFAAVASSAATTVPTLNVPACPSKGTIQYTTSVPSGGPPFPRTRVDACHDASSMRFVFSAFEERYFYFNPNYTTNDPIYEYEVMEAFVARGTGDPQTYLEFEVAPNNVTFNAFIYNPSKVRAAGAPFDTLYLQEPVRDGLTARTRIDRDAHSWTSEVRIPLGLFNVDNGQAKGTKWRMNFFRTVVNPRTFPAQDLGAWNPPDEANFHKTPFFGNVNFV